MNGGAVSRDEVDLVGWELLALAATSYRLRSDRRLRSDPLANTAFLESFLTHVRILSEYFMGRRRRDGSRGWKPESDLVPQDLVESWTPPQLGAQLDEALPKIGAFLSHLSRRRLDSKEAWGFLGLAETVLAVASAFADALSASSSPHASAFRQSLWYRVRRRSKSHEPSHIAPPKDLT